MAPDLSKVFLLYYVDNCVHWYIYDELGKWSWIHLEIGSTQSSQDIHIGLCPLGYQKLITLKSKWKKLGIPNLLLQNM